MSSQGSRRSAGRRFLLGVCLLAVLLIPSAQATPGALDPSFGTGGKVTTPIGSGYGATALVLQPDGKLVAAGPARNGSNDDFGLARYNADGSLDTSFGSGGMVMTPIGSSHDDAFALVLQQDGKLVAAGSAYNGPNTEFALVRYNADGTLDSSFGSGGKVTTPVGSSDSGARALVLQPDGKLVAAGYGRNGSQTDFAFVRYKTDGTLDTSFGSGTGKVTTSVGSGNDAAEGLVLQADGKLVAVGYTANGLNDDFALVRYNADGTLDTSFGSGGKTTTGFGSGYDDPYTLALQPDGKLIAAGYSENGADDDFALARYNANGFLDSSFGSLGRVTTSIGSGNDDAFALALQTDGRIVAAGYGQNGLDSDFAVVRYNADGTLDTTFGSGGKVTTPVGSGNDEAFALALQSDGKIVAAGASANGSYYGFALVRYLVTSTLTVAKAGGGTGTVTSSPSGIDCGSSCSSAFLPVPVTLTATAAAGSSFTGWSGDCSGTGSCTLTMSADHSATATFESDKTLTVTKVGSGSGTVTSSPGGISCGSTCTHAFAHGTSVELTASASSKSKFSGWSGDCSGTGSCTLTMSADHSATANFKIQCVVPKVKGKKLAAAKSAIKKAHCSVGRVTRAFSSKVKKGRVISQKPSSGKKLAKGSKVKLKVSKGKKP